jgi:prepilin-type N-terminal cleavage/methylation domain-containing protein
MRDCVNSKHAQHMNDSKGQSTLANYGFSLIELIAVLAIMAILVAAATPVVIRRIDQAARTREVNDLGAISNAMVLQILRSNKVSSAATWATDAANWMQLPVSAVSTNARGYGRVLFIDTNGWLGTVSLPYGQSVWGTTNAPTQARMMIVSCISGTNGVSQTSGPLAASLFNDVWNTAKGYKPATWTNWKGNVDDLFVQRLNLQPLFHHLVLFNQSSSVNWTYGINSETNTVATNEVSSYFLDVSILGLYITNGTLQASEIINRDMSRLYQTAGQTNAWSDQPGPGPGGGSIQTGMDNIAYAFINSQSSPPSGSGSNFRGDNTFGIVDVLVSYMSAYSSWANMPSNCFYTEGVAQGNVQKIPEYILMCNAIACFGGSVGCGGNGNAACTVVP